MNSDHATLCDVTIASTLDTLVAEFREGDYQGATVELWVFDGLERRQRARKALRDRGIDAHVRSAYKPLVHAFLDDIDLAGVTKIRVRYPNLTHADAGRFLLEAYPLQSLVGGRPIVFEPMRRRSLRAMPAYRVELELADGRTRRLAIGAPNVLRPDHLGRPCLACSGWVRVRSNSNPDRNRDGPIDADLSAAFATALAAIGNHAWPAATPFFERMVLRIEAPFTDRILDVGNECLSTGEAMHEDLYFSALEVFNRLSGRKPGDRRFQPGQIVPDIVARDGPVRVVVTLESHCAAALDRPPSAQAGGPLAAVGHWLEPDDIHARLDALGGRKFEVLSLCGRAVRAAHVAGPDPQIVISAGQHANESSGPVGALRAGERLAQEGRIGFVLSPLENPDGYALFRQLCAENPNHMHHAARYTASGADLEYMDRGFENEIRHLALEKTGAELHLNLHGYPAHEWTRPFTGYVPNGFALWTIPKGFFLILRYKPGWKALAETVLQAVIDDLATYEPIVEMNRRQLAAYNGHVPHAGYRVDRHIPVMADEVSDALFPITLITEAPDETIYGRDFVIAHTAQMRAVLAAAEAYRQARGGPVMQKKLV